MRVVLLVLIVLWPATAQSRWVGTAELLQSRDAYGDMLRPLLPAGELY